MVITHTTLIDGDVHEPIEILDSGDDDHIISFRTQPISKSDNERTVKLVIESGLAERSHGAKLENTYTHGIKIGSSNHLSVRSIEGTSGEKESTLRLELSSSVNEDVAARFITITPAAKFHLSTEGDELFFTGAFTPGTTYTVAIAKGLTAVDDATLDHDYSTTVVFPDLERKLDFQSEGMFLSASGYKTLAIESVNVDSALIAVDRVYRNNVFRYFIQDYDYHYYRGRYGESDEDVDGDDDKEIQVGEVSHSMGDPIARKKIALRNVHNKKTITTVSLEPFIKNHEPGLYRVVLAGKAPLNQQTRWILITDVGIVAKHGGDDLVIWTSSFKDLSAVTDANITVISDQNQVLATGHTDARGLWQTPQLAKTKQGTELNTSQKGSDFSFLVFGRNDIDLSPFDIAGDRVPKDGYSAFVYGERDIYRPGETVEGVAVIRTRALDGPPQMPLVVKHWDADSERESIRVNSGDGGIASFKINLPPYARTGRHRVDVIAGKDVVGSYNFQVEEFVPDRIKVEVKPKKPFAAPGNDLAYDVRGAYLFGPPASNLAVDTRVRLVSSSFDPQG